MNFEFLHSIPRDAGAVRAMCSLPGYVVFITENEHLYMYDTLRVRLTRLLGFNWIPA